MLLTRFLAIATLAIASVAAVSPTVTEETPSNYLPLDGSVVERTRDVPIPQVLARQLTNAKRLKMGLKLKPPVRRSRGAFFPLAEADPPRTNDVFPSGPRCCPVLDSFNLVSRLSKIALTFGPHPYYFT